MRRARKSETKGLHFDFVPGDRPSVLKLELTETIDGPRLPSRGTGWYNFGLERARPMPNTLGHKLCRIYQDDTDRCDLGITIPLFHQSVGAPLLAVNALIEKSILEIVETFVSLPCESIRKPYSHALRSGLWVQPIILTATHSLISLELYIVTTRGGHRNHYTRTLNVGVKEVRELLLADIFTDQRSASLFFSKYCAQVLKARWDVTHIARWELEIDRFSTTHSIGFRDDELIVVFAPHQVRQIEIGRTLVRIPLNDAHRFLSDWILDLLDFQRPNTDVLTNLAFVNPRDKTRLRTIADSFDESTNIPLPTHEQ